MTNEFELMLSFRPRFGWLRNVFIFQNHHDAYKDFAQTF